LLYNTVGYSKAFCRSKATPNRILLPPFCLVIAGYLVVFFIGREKQPGKILPKQQLMNPEM